MHQHSRLRHVLSHLDDEMTCERKTMFDMERLERNLQQIFGCQASAPSPSLFLQPCAAGEADPGEPSDRFVRVSRSLQDDTSMGYTNARKPSRAKQEAKYREEQASQGPLDMLTDPKVLLGVAATGLAFAFFPSSSPVPRSFVSRLWPHLIQLAIAYLVHIRKEQDRRGDTKRSNIVLYIITVLLQFFTAIRDYQGHTLQSFTARALLGPLDPLFSFMKSIIIALPSFLLKSVLLSGIAFVGKITVVSLIAVSIIAALGLLIVLASENL